MNRKLYAVLLLFAAAGIITACGTAWKATVSTVYITDKGTVVGANIEDFNEDYYDEEELKSYITESVDSYVASNGDGSVELDSFQIQSVGDQGSVAQLYLNYASYIDYAQFNEVTMYAGSVTKAREQGYAFDSGFQKVENAGLAGNIDVTEITEEKELKVVIIGEGVTVKVDGTIQYVSDGNVEITGKDTAVVSYDMEDPQVKLAYIIYK